MLSTIGLVIDVLIVAIVVIFALIGFKKGFLKSIISLFSWVVCLLVAIFTAKYVARWINGIYDFSALIGGRIEDSLVNLNEYFSKSISSFGKDKDALIAGLENVEGLNGLLKQLIKVVFSNTAVDMSSEATVANVVGASLGQIAMVIIAGILVFIVIKIVIAILSRIFDNIARTKVLGGLNKILGLVFGIIKAACIVVLFNGLLVSLSLIPPVNKTITPLIQDNTHVEKFIYNKTDELVGKYIIEGNAIQDWVTNLWNSR